MNNDRNDNETRFGKLRIKRLFAARYTRPSVFSLAK